MTGHEARDDEREALIARLEGAKALFHEFYSTGVAPLSLDFDPAYEAIEDAVRALRARKHPEPEITDAEALRLGKAAWVAYQGDTEWAQSVVADSFSPADDLPEEALDMIAVARAVIAALWVPVGEGDQ